MRKDPRQHTTPLHQVALVPPDEGPGGPLPVVLATPWKQDRRAGAQPPREAAAGAQAA